MAERSLLDYWLILQRRRFAIYLVVLTSVAAAVIIGATVTPIYEARASLYIPTSLQSVSYVSGDSASTLARQQSAPLHSEESYKPYVGILKSLQLAQMVNAQYPSKQLVKLLRSDIDVEVTDEFIIRVYARDQDPQLAADVANAYVQGLNRILAESSQAQVQREPEYIKSALSSVQGELAKAEADLMRFEKQHQIASLEAELAALSAEKTTLVGKREDNLVQLAAHRGKEKALVAEIKREGEDFEVSEVATTTPLADELRSKLADVITQLAEAESEFGKNNITIIGLKNRRQELERQLGAEIKRWISSRISPRTSHLETLRQQLIEVVIEGQRLQATGDAYLLSLKRLNERLRPYPAIKVKWVELNQNAERLRSMKTLLRNNLTEVRLQSDREMQMVVHLDHSRAPTRPAFPIWWLNALVALFAGALAGIGYAFFLNYVEETRQVRTHRLVRAILGPDKA